MEEYESTSNTSEQRREEKKKRIKEHIQDNHKAECNNLERTPALDDNNEYTYVI